MTGFTKVSRVLAVSEPGVYHFFCKPCGWPHRVNTNATQTPAWGFNDNLEQPTFSPSVLVRTGSAVDPNFVWEEGDPPRICHSFVTDGRIQYLSDCDHALAGQTVDLADWEQP